MKYDLVYSVRIALIVVAVTVLGGPPLLRGSARAVLLSRWERHRVQSTSGAFEAIDVVASAGAATRSSQEIYVASRGAPYGEGALVLWGIKLGEVKLRWVSDSLLYIGTSSKAQIMARQSEVVVNGVTVHVELEKSSR
jgi:hypothetical protein